MSIAGGVFNAIAHGVEMQCATIQIFTKSNNQWKAKELTDEEVEKYFEDRKRAGIDPVVGHTSYLINLASPKEDIYKKSVASLELELERCHRLAIDDLVLHPGSYLDTTEEIGIKKIVASLNMIFEKTADIKTRIALETTAGQGTNLGYKFEQLSEMIVGVENKKRISVCMDTCHIFAAGYDIREKRGYEDTIKKFDEIVGLDYLKAMHLNDSKMEFGKKRDRHEHIGRGFLGEKAFKYIMKDKRLAHIPKFLETPKEENGLEMDKVNLDLLRKFYKS